MSSLEQNLQFDIIKDSKENSRRKIIDHGRKRSERFDEAKANLNKKLDGFDKITRQLEGQLKDLMTIYEYIEHLDRKQGRIRERMNGFSSLLSMTEHRLGRYERMVEEHSFNDGVREVDPEGYIGTPESYDRLRENRLEGRLIESLTQIREESRAFPHLMEKYQKINNTIKERHKRLNIGGRLFKRNMEVISKHKDNLVKTLDNFLVDHKKLPKEIKDKLKEVIDRFIYTIEGYHTIQQKFQFNEIQNEIYQISDRIHVIQLNDNRNGIQEYSNENQE